MIAAFSAAHVKAFILAAGLGTRLRALGLDVPKVMVEIGGKPLLQHHFEWLREQGIRECIVNLHYRPEKITEYFGDGRRWGVSITYSHEPELLGTAGAVKKMEHALRDGPFLVLYGDNLVRMRLASLVEFHRQRGATATMALFATPEPWTGGVPTLEADGRVRRFVEKPDRKEVSTNLVSAGIYVFEPAVLETIPAGQAYDFGREVIPGLIAGGQPVYAMHPLAYIWDIGTPERLQKAQQDYANGVLDQYT